MADGSSGCKEGKNKGREETDKSLKRIDHGRIIALIETLHRKGRQGSTARRGGDLGSASIRNRRREPGKEDGADKWVRSVGDRGKNKKGSRSWAVCGRRSWASGPLWAEREVSFLFPFFLFQTLFKTNSFQFNFKQNFSNFFTEFYKLFKLHTSNQKSMQRQIMMHTHLLSLV
jgi:hypothetical protein